MFILVPAFGLKVNACVYLSRTYLTTFFDTSTTDCRPFRFLLLFELFAVDFESFTGEVSKGRCASTRS